MVAPETYLTTNYPTERDCFVSLAVTELKAFRQEKPAHSSCDE